MRKAAKMPNPQLNVMTEATTAVIIRRIFGNISPRRTPPRDPLQHGHKGEIVTRHWP
jgi:hypothetical protein